MSDDAPALTPSLQRMLSTVGLFVAPTTLISGICFYFGAVSTRRRLEYYGVDAQALGLTTRDHVVASIDVLYFPILRLLLVVAVLVAAVIVVRRLAAAERYTSAIRVAAWALTSAGAVCMASAVMWLVFGRLVVKDATPNFTGWSILLGTGLLIAGWWSLATIREHVDHQGQVHVTNLHRALLGIAATVMVVALFWLTNIYASDEGYRRAAFDADGLWAKETGVVLDSTEPVALPASLVKQSVLPATDSAAAPVYRYECLRVLKVVGDTWLLVPAKWERNLGYTLMVTPSATQHLTPTVRAGLAASTGRAENITRFWQCPEVVRTFDAAELDTMLLSDADAVNLFSATVSTTGRAPDVLPAAVSAISGSCESSAPTEPADVRVREISAQNEWLRQRVLRFTDPAVAAQFVAVVQDMWLDCQGQVLAFDRRGGTELRTLGGVGQADDILTVSDSAPDGAAQGCAQSIAAKSNVVIEAQFCGKEPTMSGNAVKAIRDGIPT